MLKPVLKQTMFNSFKAEKGGKLISKTPQKLFTR